jgi:adenine-specific DNA-methyltransferase
LASKGLRLGDDEWEAVGIFEYITRPRIEAAMTGKTADGKTIEGSYRFVDEFPYSDGFQENVEFLELLYLDRNTVERGRAFESIASLLWMKAGAQGPVISTETPPFALPEGSRYGVLFQIESWRDFVDAVDARSDVTHVFIGTDSTAQYQQVVSSLSPTITTSMLYDDYLRNFELNVGADYLRTFERNGMDGA